jgi:glyoxylase-like metal-dependent hydrolase (beta-lactamase superfamily II)
MSTPPFIIHTLELGPMENFVYVIEDRVSRRAAVVDPAWEPAQVMALAAERGLTISDILLTHSHHDHVNGVEEMLAHYDAELHLLKDEARFWGASLARPTLHHGGDHILLGDSTIEVLHTPGHTPGSACYALPGHLITGDTLFVFGCGRCDLRGGDPEAMFHTLKNLRDGLPEDTLLHPGHHYAHAETSTLAEQRAGNPFLHFDEVAAFVHYRMHEHDRIRDTPYGPVSRDSVRRVR